METSTAIKNQIVGMTKAGMSIRSIAKLLNISKSTAAYWVKRFKDGSGDVMQVPVQEDLRKRLPLKKSILQMNCLTIHVHQLKLLANNMNVHAETGRRRLKKGKFDVCASL